MKPCVLLCISALLLLPPRARSADMRDTAMDPSQPAPALEGAHLGDTLQRLEATLGPAAADPLTDDPNAEVRSLRFHGGALMALVSRTHGAARLLLTRRDGGALAGVRVGDSADQVIGLWGEPRSSNGRTALYVGRNWFVAVSVDPRSSQVAQLMLGQLSTAVQPSDLAPPAWMRSPGGAAPPP